MTNNDSPPVDSADPMLRDKTGFIDRSLDLRKTSQGWAKAVNARNRILGRSRS